MSLSPEDRERIYQEEKLRKEELAIRASAHEPFEPLWRVSKGRRTLNYLLLAILVTMGLFVWLVVKP